MRASMMIAETLLLGPWDTVRFRILEAQSRFKVSRKSLETAIGEAVIAHDRAGDSHYDLLSALVKSMRGNAPDAAVFWVQVVRSG